LGDVVGMKEKRISEKILMSPLEYLIAEIDREAVGERVKEFNEENELTEHLKTVKRVRDKQYIRFFLDDILLGIPLSGALEISRRPDITPLPNLPDWVLGVSNIRGEIISITDLKIFFGLPIQKKNNAGTGKMVIILHNHEIKVGAVVDRVTGIFSPERTGRKIQSSPYKKESAETKFFSKNSVSSGELISYISGVIYTGETADKENLVNILDIDKLLASPRMNAFRTE